MKRKVLITGSTQGLGLYLAQNAFQQDQVLVCGSNKNRLENAVELLSSEVADVMGLVVNFLDEDLTTSFCEEVQKSFGTPDIIVHNLGGSLKLPFESGSQEWSKVMRLNLLAAQQIDNFMLKSMLLKGRGKLIYIGSMATATFDGLEPYVIAKSALDAYIKVLGRKLAGTGLVACGIRPGPINVPDRYLTNLEMQDKEGWIRWAQEHRILEGRLLTMDEVSKLVNFLSSDMISYNNGSIFDLFGGSD